jgi:hypothetical protein
VVFVSSTLKSAYIEADVQTPGNPDLQLFIYPNPTGSTLRINTNLELGRNSVIRVYNTLGSEIFIRKINSTGETVDVSNLPDGIYLLRLQSENGNSSVQRFVVRH